MILLINVLFYITVFKKGEFMDNKYDVYFNGTHKTTINPGLVKKRNITDEQLKVIKNLYVERYTIEELMKEESADNKSELKNFFEKWTNNQFYIQKTWGAEPNKSLHPFWQVPHCNCPNHLKGGYQEEAITHYNKECPVHGN